jgi:hypothetical protein
MQWEGLRQKQQDTHLVMQNKQDITVNKVLSLQDKLCKGDTFINRML